MSGRLVVRNFSCLKNADFRLARVNVLIGPQGSGKSLTAKLLYFCLELLSNFQSAAEQELPIDQYKANVGKNFSQWFPPKAWGGERFSIYFESEQFSIRILRRLSKGEVADDVSVQFSPWFEEVYRWAVHLHHQQRRRIETNDAEAVPWDIDRAYRIRDMVWKRVAKDLGSGAIRSQTYIPAGRSFFTSIGRLVAGIEQGASLDPVTIRFARMLFALREYSASQFYYARLGKEFLAKRKNMMMRLLGGEVRKENETEYVLMADGRKVPFACLSSGQQELLPMLLLMNHFTEIDAYSKLRNLPEAGELLYIEEPEAHLFPAMQGQLMEFLIGLLVAQSRRNLFITTHSPYIMSKLNVFLKAGQLARRKKRTQAIERIVRRETWITSEMLSAMAIKDGEFISLLGDDDLIDAEYLDQVSEDISREYSELLELESEIDR